MGTTAAVQFYDEHCDRGSLYAEAVRGLRARPKAIPPKFFYDRRGSELFEAICRLPEYYLTRTEFSILRAHARDIADLTGPGAVLVELGSGAADKVRLLLDALRPAAYLGIDISKEFLLQATRGLARDYPWLPVHAACADFCQPLTLSYPPPGQKKLAFFPGSSIGNFHPHEAATFMTGLKSILEPGDGFVIGVDLKKDPRVLHAAYNDAEGITAQFNLNLLERMRRELGAMVDVTAFAHEARYNADAGRIEMYLVSRRAQELRIGNEAFTFAADEALHTENSYKYGAEEFQALAREAGYQAQAMWTDADDLFSVHYLRVP